MATKVKTKQLYPFTNYSPKTEARLKKLFLLGERGSLRRVVQDGMMAGILGFFPIYSRKRERARAVTFSDEEIKQLFPKAEIIQRGLGGVAIELEANARKRRPKITSRTPRITPKVGRLR